MNYVIPLNYDDTIINYYGAHSIIFGNIDNILVFIGRRNV